MSINWEKVKSGLPFDEIKVIDVHGHLGKTHPFFTPGGGAPAQVVESMDKLGVDSVIVSHMDAIESDYKYGNRQVLEAAKEYKGRIFGYAVVNPHYPDDMIKELDNYIKLPEFKGIKLHPSLHGVKPDFAGFDCVYAYADERKLPVLVHTWGIGDAVILEKIADKYKNAKFIIAHVEVALKEMDRIAEAINNRDNLYGDTAVSMAPEGSIETYVEKVNPKRILYGSDMAFYSPNLTFGRIAMADISDDIKLDIFARNAERLFGL